MSISTEIARLQGLKGRQKTKVVELGLGSPVTLEAITTAIEGIEKQGAVIKEISAKAEEAEIPAGYHDGTGKVTIAAKEQAKIIPENIKAGITILGEEGTYSGEGAKMQTKTATPTKQAQSITPDMGYDGLSKVDVEAIPDEYQDVSGVTAGAADVLANKIIVGADGSQITGAMPNQGAVQGTIDGLTVESYTIPEGYHSGAGTVKLTSDIEEALAAI